ncbi:unnamed protein product [Ectocarpus sp. 8 AP-2014]
MLLYPCTPANCCCNAAVAIHVCPQLLASSSVPAAVGLSQARVRRWPIAVVALLRLYTCARCCCAQADTRAICAIAVVLLLVYAYTQAPANQYIRLDSRLHYKSDKMRRNLLKTNLTSTSCYRASS